jgi:hypothetical protein
MQLDQSLIVTPPTNFKANQRISRKELSALPHWVIRVDLVCPQHVPLWGNLGSADCRVFAG